LAENVKEKSMKITARNVIGQEFQVDSEKLVMKTTIRGIAVKDGKVLIVPLSNGIAGEYNYPGGRIEKGENHIDALIREFKEETGFDVKPVKLLDVYTIFYKSFREDRTDHITMILYLVEIIDGDLCSQSLTDEEKSYTRKAEFVTPEELKSKVFSFDNQAKDSILEHISRICS
jgi:8-oxo-dGTP pyrophosphatase MutT (NUDIX family)